jgi:hypothetical protein
MTDLKSRLYILRDKVKMTFIESQYASQSSGLGIIFQLIKGETFNVVLLEMKRI